MTWSFLIKCMELLFRGYLCRALTWYTVLACYWLVMTSSAKSGSLYIFLDMDCTYVQHCRGDVTCI